MLKNRIIPCLDGKNGRVVKGINFVDLQDAGDPVEQAIKYKDHGFKNLHIVDLDGALTGETVNLHIIKEIVRKFDLK